MQRHSKSKDINTKLITAYWCNYVSPDYEERFVWSWEKVQEAVQDVGLPARLILAVLADSVPGAKEAAYFAAGPLEDYINLVVKEKISKEARSILNDKSLDKYLNLVWGDAEKLKNLADKSNSKIEDTPFNTDLTFLSIQDVVKFWCHICASPLVTNYEKAYDQVIDKLFNQTTREEVKNDLLISAPDKKAEQYLNKNIFILQK